MGLTAYFLDYDLIGNALLVTVFNLVTRYQIRLKNISFCKGVQLHHG